MKETQLKSEKLITEAEYKAILAKPISEWTKEDDRKLRFYHIAVGERILAGMKCVSYQKEKGKIVSANFISKS